MKANALSRQSLIRDYIFLGRKSMAASLTHHLLSRMQHGKLVLSNEDSEHVFGSRDGLQCRVHVHCEDAYTKILHGGAVGAAEAYMDGDWTTDNLPQLIRLMLRNRQVLELMQQKMSWFGRLGLKLFHYSRRDTLSGSQRNIAYHYDLGNDFYQLFLDPTMMYSSGIFNDASDSMEQASINKLETICRKLALTPRDHLLEIGTGWGGLAMYAARHYGCKVTTTTISDAQHQHAAEQIRAAGLADQITLLKTDYRELTGSYDKLVSVEMIEAVGLENLSTFFDKCSSLLKPDGEMLLQSITIADQRYETASQSVDFIQRYIFPGGALPSITVLLKEATASTDLHAYSLDDITEHYAETLKRWRQSFLRSIPSVMEMGFGEQFIRMWDYYLAYCEGGFNERAIGCVQMQFHKSDFRRAIS